jgi:hypothetical protein
MATMYAGPANVYTPAFDTQANLIINYSRNPKKFKINELMTLTPVSKQIGKYLRIKPEAQGNVTSTWNQSRRWADGAPMPLNEEGRQKHEFLEYFCERYFEGLAIGYQTEEQAIWNIVKSQSDALAGKMMTGLAVDAYAVLQDSGNYDNTATATVAGGGKWDVATGSNPYIQNSLNYAVEKIQQSTMNAVGPEDLVLVLSPTLAKQMAVTSEIRDFVAQQQTSPAYIEGKLFSNQLGNYGLPSILYGIKVVVDPLVRDTAAIGATTSKSFVAGSTTAYLISRQGALSSDVGGSNFSFLHCFTYTPEELRTDVVDDTVNLRKIIRVLHTRQVKAVATEAAFLFTACVD